MDPVSATLIMSAGSAVASGMAGHAQAKGEQERAEINSYIGRTRALQTDTVARENLSSELGSLRAAMGANGQTANVGTLAFIDELRQNRNRERRINVGNQNSAAADFALQGRNAGSAAKWSLIGGAAKAGPSLFDLYDYKRKGG